MNMARYDAFRDSIRCSDCGTKAIDDKARGVPWATETQCFACLKMYGTPESRGFPSAPEKYMHFKMESYGADTRKLRGIYSRLLARFF